MFFRELLPTDFSDLVKVPDSVRTKDESHYYGNYVVEFFAFLQVVEFTALCARGEFALDGACPHRTLPEHALVTVAAFALAFAEGATL